MDVRACAVDRHAARICAAKFRKSAKKLRSREPRDRGERTIKIRMTRSVSKGGKKVLTRIFVQAEFVVWDAGL